MKIAKILAIAGLAALFSVSAASAEKIFMGGNNQGVCYLITDADNKGKTFEDVRRTRGNGGAVTIAGVMYWSTEDYTVTIQTECYPQNGREFAIAGYTKYDRWGNEVEVWDADWSKHGDINEAEMTPIQSHTFAENIYNWLQNNYWNKK